jgi:hypothetical protein
VCDVQDAVADLGGDTEAIADGPPQGVGVSFSIEHAAARELPQQRERGLGAPLRDQERTLSLDLCCDDADVGHEHDSLAGGARYHILGKGRIGYGLLYGLPGTVAEMSRYP